MLTFYQLEVLKAYLKEPGASQRAVSKLACISVGMVNKAVRQLREEGLLTENGEVTAAGMEAMEPYRVRNAVILAAGLAKRFAPLSFEKPKAMFEVRGEVLIERMIRQLKEAGIDDITVVTGYMKESFFYLEDDFGVSIVVNPEYATRNNHASLYCVRQQLGNSYVLCSDEYYAENIFSAYEYRTYFSGAPCEKAQDRVVLIPDSRSRIVAMPRSGKDVYTSVGPAYFDGEFARKLIGFIGDEYDSAEIKDKLWDNVVEEHLDDFEVYLRAFEEGILYEFDSVADLVKFDRDFFANVDSNILDNICKTLECTRDDITEVAPVSAGLTNLSTMFVVKGVKYIYRHPGNGTDEIINRKAEEFALRTARELGLDDTFIYEEPDEGWKISRFVEGASELDYRNREQVAKALQMVRTLHTSGKQSPWSFDFYAEGVKIAQMLRDMNYPLPRDFDGLAQRVGVIANLMAPEVEEQALCHNDFYGPNFLVTGEQMRLIDWEYAAMGDPACDLGNFVAQGSGYSVEETLDILPLYYGRPATETEQRHCLGAVGVVGWYWYVWAMYKEAMGAPVGEWLYIWYKAAKQYTAAAESLYL